MSRLPDVSGAELVKALGKTGFIVLRQKGSHVSMEKTDSTGRWHDILKQTGLTREEFSKLL